MNKDFDSIIEAGRGLGSMLNIDFTNTGALKKRKGWKTFEGMVKVLEELNDKYKRYGGKGNFTVQLPLKRYRRKRDQIQANIEEFMKGEK